MKTKLIIFGITGDLSTRKLLPAIEKITATKEYKDIEIIGVSRRKVDVDVLLRTSIGNVDLAKKLSVFTMDLSNQADYSRLSTFIGLDDNEQLLVYLSVPPQATAQIVDFMGKVGLNTPNVKLLFEKPFGTDLTSAKEIIARTARYYKETQIYRIDHYLAKEMAQNIVAFRGGNALFSHVWDSSSIESIEILALEKIGIEGRAQFYEQTGALRDFLQGHLMQLLALVLMDIPANFDWEQLPLMRLDALDNLLAADPKFAIRGQYEGYQKEVDNFGSNTETFVSLQLFSQDLRWKNIPFLLTTGKAMNEKTTEIRINFRKFHEAQSNCLVLRIQPNEGVEIDLFTKKPGYDQVFEVQKLAFAYPVDTILPDAYEQVLVDAIRARKSLFTTGKEVLRSWQILQPVLESWAMNAQVPHIYPKNASTHDMSSV
jgi:glucose-6-phosphate 1-dehydrogenase